MAVSTDLLLYYGYSLIAVVLAIGTGLAAVRTKRDKRDATTYLVALLAIATPVAFGLARVAHVPGYGVFEIAWVALPALTFGAVMTNIANMRELGIGGRVLAAPVLAWNCVLGLLYAARVASDVLFVDIGTPLSVPLAAWSLAQGMVGSEGAEALPVWVWLPILLPTRADASGNLLARTSGALASSFVLGVVVLAINPALDIVREADAIAEGEPASPRGDIKSSLRLGDDRWGKNALDALTGGGDGSSTSDLRRDIERATSIGVQEVEFGIRADLVDDGSRLARLESAVRQSRAAGLRIALRTVAPTALSVTMHPKTFAERMQHAHWILAERFEPDVLILVDCPYGRDTKNCVGNLEPAKWLDLIKTAAHQIHEGKPRQRLATILTSPLPRSREIWLGLADGTTIQELRFRIEGNSYSSDRSARACIALAGWLAETPPRLTLAIDASPPTALSFGGTSAVVTYFRRILGLAAMQRSVATVGLGDVRDGTHGLSGLFTAMGRRRPIVDALPDLLRQSGIGSANPGR
ncbi:MAG: hypothetical protein H6832_01100 [Planctomycetes bacterium]|nr:hypothetical protein [Planctomycetota bacterium]MCB9916981.1 hypothetical protein [Planctomycetota bacterium]